MARQVSMPAMFPPVSLLIPAADAAGRTSTYLSLHGIHKAWIVCEVNQGNAATVALTPLQATTSGGAGSKAINATRIWLNNASAVSDALVAQALAALFTTDATLADKIVVFEIEPDIVMDLANGFDHIGISTGASNAANITEAKLYGWQRYQQATPPTANA